LWKTVECQAIDIHDIGVRKIERRIQIEGLVPIPFESGGEVVKHHRCNINADIAGAQIDVASFICDRILSSGEGWQSLLCGGPW
jgi:hypothetical protein